MPGVSPLGTVGSWDNITTRRKHHNQEIPDFGPFLVSLDRSPAGLGILTSGDKPVGNGGERATIIDYKSQTEN